MISNVPSLEAKLITYYVNQIKEKKIKFIDIEKKLGYVIREKVLFYLIENYRNHFYKTIYESLRNELLVATAKNIDIDEDMRYIHDGMNFAREYVRDILIHLQEPRILYGIVNINEEDVNEYDPRFVEEFELISDNYKDLEIYMKNHQSSNEYSIIQYETSTYGPIKEYEHPQWESIYFHSIANSHLI